MASLNGVTIKNLKQFMSHEGPMWQGNIYLGNKKIGFWSNDSHGGPDEFFMESKYSGLKLMKEFARLKPECEYIPEEIFMEELLELILREKEYKKMVKRGFEAVLFISDSYHYYQIGLTMEEKHLSDQEVYERKKKTVTEIKKKLQKESDKKKHELKIFRRLDDFVIGEPIKLSDILIDTPRN